MRFRQVPRPVAQPGNTRYHPDIFFISSARDPKPLFPLVLLDFVGDAIAVHPSLYLLLVDALDFFSHAPGSPEWLPWGADRRSSKASSGFS